jgi:asparagine N-glycosylation enzyme membrane subunit Stt3
MDPNPSRQQNRNLAFFLIIWALTSAIGVYVRLYPLFSHNSYQASEQASLVVIANLRKTLAAKIDEANPDLSPAEKQKLLNAQVNTIIHGQNTAIRRTIDRVAKTIDQKVTHKYPYPYLLASDSYYYFDLTQNIANTGRISNEIKGSKYFNPKMSAPLGYWEPLNLHPYIGFAVYKILAEINPDIPLMFAVSFTPLLLTIMCAFAFLLICGHWRCSPMVSFVSTVFFLMAPIFIKRSTFAWYDDDGYSVFFPLLILWMIFKALRHRDNFNALILWAAAACATLSVYALFWHGWVFLLSVVLISAVLIVLGNHWVHKRKQETRPLLIFFGLIGLGSLFSISVSFGPAEFFVLFQEGWKAINDFLNPGLSLWPDLYIAVGELLPATFLTTVGLAGGGFFVIMALIGLGVSLVHSFKAKEENYFAETIILGTFLFFTTFMALGAQRFILLWVVPLSALFPLGLKYVFAGIQKRVPGKIFLPLSIILGLLLVVPRVQSSYQQVPSLLNKIFNDVWERAFTKIREKTPPNSIINTWWPPGHFIKAMADRRVTFDGATINKPQAYWLANVLLNSDERKAVGLLRMLNNSANEATDYLQARGFPLSKAVQLLKDITPLNETKARDKIGRLLTPEQTEHLLSLTHKMPAPSYLLIYKDMVDSNIQLHFVGNWDFAKAEELNKDPQLRSRLPSKRSSSYASFLWNMAGGQPRYSGELPLQARSADTLLFDENVQIHLGDMLCQVNSRKFGVGTPLSIFYEQEGRVIEKVLPHASLSYSVLYSTRDGGQQCLLLDRLIAKSLIIKMYHFEGKDLQYLRPVIKETDLSKRNEIYVYEVNWPKFFEDLNRP